jgi:hypothetical protein
VGELGGNDSKAEHKFCLDEEGKVLGTGSGIGILEMVHALSEWNGCVWIGLLGFGCVFILEKAAVEFKYGFGYILGLGGPKSKVK